MSRTITVKGTGAVSVKPDTIVLSMTLKSLDREYNRSMAQATEQIGELRKALENVGFSKECLKTTGFDVHAEHESKLDHNNNYKTVFVGYACVHRLKLEFDFDTQVLSSALGAIAGCVTDPELNVQFTVKNKESVRDELLGNAAKNARHKAEILAKSSGVALGQLIAVDYNWGEQNVYSRTEYRMDGKCMAMASNGMDMDITPDQIDLTDTVTFVWEIV